jgi:hypothetical protein
MGPLSDRGTGERPLCDINRVVVRVVSVLGACTLLLPTATSGARIGDLQAWAFPRPNIAGVSAAGFDAPLVKHVHPGIYRIHVRAQGDMPFHLVGPGVNRITPRTRPGHPVYKTWTVRLRKGRYRYAAVGLVALQYAANGMRISGSFRVP